MSPGLVAQWGKDDPTAKFVRRRKTSSSLYSPRRKEKHRGEFDFFAKTEPYVNRNANQFDSGIIERHSKQSAGRSDVATDKHKGGAFRSFRRHQNARKSRQPTTSRFYIKPRLR